MAKKPKLPEAYCIYHVYIINGNTIELLCKERITSKTRAVTPQEMCLDWMKSSALVICENCAKDERWPLLELAATDM